MLRCLYAQKNLIASIGPGDLAGLGALVTLDLSHNNLKTLAIADAVPHLKALILRNRLPDAPGRRELSRSTPAPRRGCDVAHNELETTRATTASGVLRALAAGPALATLNLERGKPFCEEISCVRKRPHAQAAVRSDPRAPGRACARDRVKAYVKLARGGHGMVLCALRGGDRPTFDNERASSRGVGRWRRRGRARRAGAPATRARRSARSEGPDGRVPTVAG